MDAPIRTVPTGDGKGLKLSVEFYLCDKNGALYKQWLTTPFVGQRETPFKKLVLVAAWLEELGFDLTAKLDHGAEVKIAFVQGAINALYTHTAPTIEGVGYGRADLEDQLIRTAGSVWETTLDALFAHCLGNITLPKTERRKEVSLTGASQLEYLRSNDSNWAFQMLMAVRAAEQKLAAKKTLNVCAAIQRPTKFDLSTLCNGPLLEFVQDQLAIKRIKVVSDTVKQGLLRHNGIWYESVALMQSSFQCAIGALAAVKPEPSSQPLQATKQVKSSGGKTAKATKTAGVLSFQYENPAQVQKPRKVKLTYVPQESAEPPLLPTEGLSPSIREAQFGSLGRVVGELKRYLTQFFVDRMYQWDDLGFILFRVLLPIAKWQPILDQYFKLCGEHLMVRNSFGFLEPAINTWEDGYLRLTPGCMTTRNVWAFAMAMNATFDHGAQPPVPALANEDVRASQAAWRTHLTFALQCGFRTRELLRASSGGAQAKRLTMKLLESLDNNVGKGVFLLHDASILTCARPIKTISAICQMAHIARCHLEISGELRDGGRVAPPNGPFLLDSGLQCGVVAVLPGLLKGYRLVTSVNANNTLYFEYPQNELIKAALEKMKTEGLLDYRDHGQDRSFLDEKKQPVVVKEAAFFLTPGGVVSPHTNVQTGACQDLPTLIGFLKACNNKKLLVFDLTTVRSLGAAAHTLLNAFTDVPVVLFQSLAKFSQMGQDKYQGGQLCFNAAFANVFPEGATLITKMHTASWCRAREIYFELMLEMNALDSLPRP